MGLHSIFVANCWYLDTPIMIAVWEALHIENKHPDVLLLWCTCNASFFCWCDGFFCYWTAFFNTQCAFNRLYTLQISQFLVLFMNAKVANCVLVQFIYLIYCCASCCNHSKSAVIWILFLHNLKTMYESLGAEYFLDGVYRYLFTVSFHQF